MSEEEIVHLIQTRLTVDVMVFGSGGDVSVAVRLLLDGQEISHSSDCK